MLEIKSTATHKLRLTFILMLGGVSIAFVLLAAKTFSVTPLSRPGCDTPIHWSLESVDSRFPLSQQEFKTTAFEAEKIWENALGKEIFVFDSSAPFQLRTEFDDRQKMTEEGQGLDKTIQEYEQISKPVRQQYDSLQAQYKKEKTGYDALAQDFKQDSTAYEKDVAKWNKRGGAPADIYNNLQDERDALEKRAKKLNSMNNDVNDLVARINILADKLNIRATNINSQIETFQEKYGEPKPFVQGLYTSPLDNITVFQFEGKEDLRLVLAHEFGHALGIKEHVANPSSLMYYLMDQQDINHPQLSQEDIAAYNLACPPQKFSRIESFNRYLIQTPWNQMHLADIIKIFQ